MIVCALCGCAGQRHTVYTTQQCIRCNNIVFVADGAGDFQLTSTALRQVIAEDGLPIDIQTVDWSHGWGRVISDQVDFCYAKAEGRRLAGQIAARKAACPKASISLVGHSAGTSVVLSAAENLPPGVIDEIVLLAPSISCDYDLRPALCSSARGIDTFSSKRDVLALGLGTAILGTADRRWAPAAGRVGFRPTVDGPADEALVAKLRVHPWDQVVAWTGNHGGHDDSYRKSYLRAYVVPLLMPAN